MTAALWPALGALLGLLLGSRLPALIGRLPEPPDLEVPEADQAATDLDSAPLGEQGPAGVVEPTYVEIASTPGVRLRLALISAAVLALLAHARAGQADLPAFLVLGLLGVAMVEIDLRRHRLPDRLNAAALGCGAVLLGAAAVVDGAGSDYVRGWLGALTMLTIYVVLYLVPGGSGLGDVKLAPALGLHLAWLGWGQLLAGLLLGFLVGGLWAIVLLAAGRVGVKTRIAYGPSMLVGALAGVVLGEPLIDWYLGV